MMIYISYPFLIAFISILWVLVRIHFFTKAKSFSWKREAQLMLVYICIVVVVRFTFFPFGKVDGQIQPLVFDAANAFPPRINLLPFVYMTDYPSTGEILLNFVGNTFMFLPLGIVCPVVFRQLNTHRKVILAGISASLLIEILQLPFFDRVSDIDDLILNSLGFLMGYGIYLLVQSVKRNKKARC
jgi:glycopeptide antibiotics resistance protein